MPSVWKSTHPDVLEWWADVEKRERKLRRLVKKVKKDTGRSVVESTGWGDRTIIGLSSHSYSEDPPLGWKLGWGKRDHGFFQPRATGRNAAEKVAVAEADALLKSLRDAAPMPRTEANERFGVPSHQLFGLHSISPGYELIGGVLWVLFGDHDYEVPKESRGRAGSPSMLDYFEPAKKSEYYAAREAAGIEDEE